MTAMYQTNTQTAEMPAAAAESLVDDYRWLMMLALLVLQQIIPHKRTLNLLLKMQLSKTSA